MSARKGWRPPAKWKMYQATGNQSDWHDEGSDRIPSYLTRLTQVPLLRPEEERELAVRARKGDEAAERRLIEANMRLVINIARHYRNRSIPLEDLIQEGAIGLMNAVKKFDPDRGFRFSTYATHWVRQTISRALGTKGKTIRVPAHVHDMIRKIERVKVRLANELKREPTLEEISAGTEIPMGKLLLALQSSQDPLSLDMTVGEEDGLDFGSLLADRECVNPESAAVSNDTLRSIQQILADLTEREQRVMRRRLGFDEDLTSVLQDIGDDLKLTRERVRQIELQAIKKLRQIARRRRMKDLTPE